MGAKLAYAAVMVAVLLAAHTAPAVACSCGADTRAFAWRAERADAIFTGKVSGIEHGVPQEVAPRGQRIRFAVESAWTGVDAPSVVIAGDDGGCGYRFELGESYLVYAERRTDGMLATNICWRTARLSSAGDDLEQLGPPTVPIPGHTTLTMLLPYLVAGGTVLLLAVLARLLLRHHFRLEGVQ